MSSTHESNRLLWRIFPHLRPLERERFVFFALLSGMLSLGQTVGLAGADALFLAEFGAKALPMTFILASGVAVTGSLGYALQVGRTRNDRLYVWMLGGAAVFLAGALFLLASGDRSMLIVFFCFVYVTQAVFINLHYPTFAADYFDSLSSKRVFPYLVACGSAGGILGGLLALGLTRIGPTEGLIVAWAVVLSGSAVFVALARRDLKRWIPVGDEADEASAEGILSALRFLRRSPLARWLTISVIGMVLALFLMQYLEMEIFARSFESPEELAAFIAVYLAVTNGIEILVLAGLTPFLLRRFGIAQANLVHPVLTLLTFGALALHPQLSVAVLARANRELMDSALAAPVRSLSYNALPSRFRGRMRALLEGIIFYAAMSIAGLALVLVGDALDTIWLSAIGVLSAMLYGAANLSVRREYLQSILDQLLPGRLDLQAVGGNLGERDVSRLADQWEHSLAEETRPPPSWLELPALLARHGLRDPILRSAHHVDPTVRVACIEALASMQDASLEQVLREALTDVDPTVRHAGVVASAHLDGSAGPLASDLRDKLEDSDPRVRAEAAMRLGSAGLATLRVMMSEEGSAAVLAALPRLPPELLPEAQAKLADEDAGVRAAALDCLTRLGHSVALSLADLEGDLAHSDVRVRLAAVRALGSWADEPSASALGRALDDMSRAVRREAAATLASLGELGVSAAIASVGSIRRWTADAALKAVAGAETDSSHGVLLRAFRERVIEAWQARVALDLLPTSSDLPLSLLRAALEDAHDRCCWIAFQALEQVEDPGVVRSIRKALDYESASDRVRALEALTNLGEREPASQLALLLEQEPIAVKLSALPAALDLPTRFEQVVQRAEASPDRWIRLAAGSLGRDPEDPPIPEVRKMEGLLALRGVPFFTHLSLEQLEALGKFMEETTYLAGELVVREDDEGEELYVILEGEAKAIKNYGSSEQIELTTHSPSGICYFGEIAILDRARRSATVVVTQDARLLTLDGERFMELILQAPEISFEVFRVLIKRLRVAEGRIRLLIDEARPPSSDPSLS